MTHVTADNDQSTAHVPPRSVAGLDDPPEILGRAMQTQVHPIPARLRERYRYDLQNAVTIMSRR